MEDGVYHLAIIEVVFFGFWKKKGVSNLRVGETGIGKIGKGVVVLKLGSPILLQIKFF